MQLPVLLLLMLNIPKLFGGLRFFSGGFVLPASQVCQATSENSEELGMLFSHSCLYSAFVCARGRH